MDKHFTGEGPATVERPPDDRLIDNILVGTLVAVFLAYSSAQLRTLAIGWNYRDLFQTLVVVLLALLTLARRRMTADHKARCLIALLTLGAIPGVYTLGLYAGTIYVFPMVAVIVAVFYSWRATIGYIVTVLAFCTWTGFRFSSDGLQMANSLAHLGGNAFHWAVYLFCLALFFAVSAFTIHRYRSTANKLFARIKEQHDLLESKNNALNQALADVKKLSGLLPICSHCKKIRDDKGYWNQLEAYVEAHSEAAFSHSICEDCAERYYPDLDLYDEGE